MLVIGCINGVLGAQNKMSEQSFTTIQREAVWLAYNKKCAYTGEPLEFSEMHIDHILPESLKDDSEKFDEIKNRYRLDNNFDLLGWENLLPCKSSINLRKSSNLFDENRTNYFLGVASKGKDEIENNIRSIEKRLNKVKITAMLAQGIEANILSITDVRKLINEYESNPVVALKLFKDYPLFEGIDVSKLLETDLAILKKTKVRFGKNDHIESISFSNDSGISRLIKTCEEYELAIKDGYYPLTTVDIKLSTYLEQYNSLLNALINAKTPSVSYLNNIGIHDLALLPGKMFPFGPDVDEKYQMMNYQDLVSHGIIIVKEITNNSIRVEETEGMGQYIEEVLRSDLNSDGIEDLLVFEYNYATHGTLGYGGACILSKDENDNEFKIWNGP